MSNEKLYNRVKTIVLNDWDPIGISEFSEAHDEYDAYIAPICKMIIEEKSAVEISKYLRFITDSMCLDAEEITERTIAERLASLS